MKLGAFFGQMGAYIQRERGHAALEYTERHASGRPASSPESKGCLPESWRDTPGMTGSRPVPRESDRYPRLDPPKHEYT